MDELAKRFADAAEKYGPQVADAAKAAAKVEAYSSLVSSFIWIAVGVGLIVGGRFLILKAKRMDDHNDWELLMFFGCIITVVGSCAFLPAIWVWIDPWTWVQINHPELWIAKKAFHL